MSEEIEIKDFVDKVVRFEGGEMTPQETLQFFAELIKTGHAWKLQGVYGRTAIRFMKAGFIDEKGNILKNIEEDEG